MAQIPFVQGTPTVSGWANVASKTFNKPTVAAGDFMVLVVGVGDVNTDPSITDTGSGGWTKSITIGSASVINQTVWTKYADASDAAASNTNYVTITPDTTRWCAGMMYVIRGMKTSGALFTSNKQFVANAGDPAVFNSISITPEANSLLIMSWVARDSNSACNITGVATDNPTWTEYADTTTTSGNQYMLGSGAAQRPQATATGNATIDVGDGSTNIDFAVTVLSISPRPPTAQTITGKGDVRKSATQTQAGKARIQKSVTQTTTGKANVRATTTRTQLGKGDIKKTTTKTQAGVARVQKSVTKTQAGKSRIQKSVAQTQQGKARIQKSVTQTQQGKGDVRKSTSQTQQGKASIASTGYTDYTRGHFAALPTDDAQLTTAYNGTEIAQVASIDADYVEQLGLGEYAIHQFKNYMGTSNAVVLSWSGKAAKDAASVTAYLQIYNRNTSSWETLDTETSAPAGTDFTLGASVSDLTNYKDGSNIIACRVYQAPA